MIPWCHRAVRSLALGLLLVAACKSARAKAPDAGIRAEAPAVDAGAREPKETFARLSPLHPPMPEARPGSWRVDHPEPPQSYGEYVWSAPRPVAGRETIYVAALGDFTPAQQAIVAETTRVLSPYFGVPVRMLEPIPASAIPAEVRRKNPYTGEPQLFTEWVLEDLLPRRRPEDALALIALTAEDLYPDPKWNFVFGQANPAERVGVWSLARFGDVAKERARVLRRLQATAVHEAGHLFGLAHCQEALCVMNGANTLEEADQWPLEPCPVCLRKLQWRFGFDVRERFEKLHALHADAGSSEEAALCATALELLDGGR
jgi:archaemetzincin